MRVYQLALGVLHGLVVLSILGLALVGQMPEEAAGWLIRPAAGQVGRRRTVGLCVRSWRWPGSRWGALGQYLAVSWRPMLLRSLVVWGLWDLSGGIGPAWVRLAPWVFWLWQGVGVGWPGLRRQAAWVWGAQGLWQIQRLVLVGYLGLALIPPQRGELAPWGLGLGFSAVRALVHFADAEATPMPQMIQRAP